MGVYLACGKIEFIFYLDFYALFFATSIRCHSGNLNTFALGGFLRFHNSLAFTVAYFVLLDVQRSFVLAFLVAVTLAFNFSFLPAFTDLLPVILTFFTIPFIDVICQKAAFLLPSVAVAVMVTFLPPVFFFKVTTPPCVTVATFVLLDFHVSFLLEALADKTVDFSVTFLPAAICLDMAERVIFCIFCCWYLA